MAQAQLFKKNVNLQNMNYYFEAMNNFVYDLLAIKWVIKG